jgi:tRNA dimethylallyltransferase
MLIVICGATATGKSGLAMILAQRWGSKILSADSRLVYREFDIGTAKPTPTEQALVPHFLIDICEPTEIMTLADYQQQAQGLIEQFATENVPILLVGGTGLYIKSVVRGMKIPKVAPNYELRSHLESIGQFQAYQMLQQVDAVAAAKIHQNDAVRTLRALEVYYITGIPISQQQGESPPSYPIIQIGLDCSSQHLIQRITQRTKNMIQGGFVEEVDNLCQKYGKDLPLLNTLGYQEIKQYLAGEISLPEAQELIILHTRQFAKRQRTWFRAIPEIQWFDVTSDNLVDNIWQYFDSTQKHHFPD